MAGGSLPASTTTDDWYHTKFALEALSDCLRMEVKPFGINVVVIEPGGIRRMARHRRRPAHESLQRRGLCHAVRRRRRLAHLRRHRPAVLPPAPIADTIAKAVTARRPKTRHTAGYGARPIIFLPDALPERAFDTFIRRATGVPS